MCCKIDSVLQVLINLCFLHRVGICVEDGADCEVVFFDGVVLFNLKLIS